MQLSLLSHVMVSASFGSYASTEPYSATYAFSRCPDNIRITEGENETCTNLKKAPPGGGGGGGNLKLGRGWFEVRGL